MTITCSAAFCLPSRADFTDIDLAESVFASPLGVESHGNTDTWRLGLVRLTRSDIVSHGIGRVSAVSTLCQHRRLACLQRSLCPASRQCLPALRVDHLQLDIRRSSQRPLQALVRAHANVGGCGPVAPSGTHRRSRSTVFMGDQRSAQRPRVFVGG